MSTCIHRYKGDKDYVEMYLDMVKRLYKNSPIFESAFAEICAQLQPENPTALLQERESIFVENAQGECIAHCMLMVDSREKQGTGWFGFFECIQNQEVFNQLWSELMQLAKEKNITKLKGPINGTIWHPYRFTSKSIEGAPAISGEMLCQPYYHEFFEQIASEQIEYYSARRTEYAGLISITKPFYEKSKEEGFTIEKVEKPTPKHMHTVYSLALAIFRNSWGYVPLVQDEFFYLYSGAKTEKLDALYLLYAKDRPIGFAVCYKESKAVLNLKTIGILDQFQGKGLGNALIHRIHTDAQKSGYSEVLYALIRAENRVKNLPQDDAEIIREYRAYEVLI